MTERKPAGEPWESFAERKIREAQAEGAFDRLPGMGRPIPDLDAPYDENWWIKQKLRRERLTVLPPILTARLEAEKTLEAIGHLSTEREVRRRLEKLNEKIRAAHYSPIAGPPDGIRPLDVDAVIAEWRKQRGSEGK